jgi:hypothetical protein
MTVLRELSNYIRFSGRAVARNLWENTHFCMERGMMNIN